jgi:hypothetical protein
MNFFIFYIILHVLGAFCSWYLGELLLSFFFGLLGVSSFLASLIEKFQVPNAPLHKTVASFMLMSVGLTILMFARTILTTNEALIVPSIVGGLFTLLGALTFGPGLGRIVFFAFSVMSMLLLQELFRVDNYMIFMMLLILLNTETSFCDRLDQKNKPTNNLEVQQAHSV